MCFNQLELSYMSSLNLIKLQMPLQDTHLLLTGGMEKILRVYDLNRPDAAPKELAKSPASIRTVAWLHNDQTILSSCTDTGGVRCVCVSLWKKCLN
jgi:WD40 repeat protein